MMKSQAPLPAVFLNESCSSSQERAKPHRVSPACGSRWILGPVVSFMLGELVQPIFPEKSIRSMVVFPGQHQQWEAQGEAGHGCRLHFKQSAIASFTAPVASPGKTFTTSCPSENKVPALQADSELPSQFALHSNNEKWFCSLPNADRAGKWALIPSGKAILLCAKLSHLELQINTMRRLESVQCNCSECSIMLEKSWT